MKKIITVLSAALALSACASKPKPFAWQEFVVPLEGGEYVTDVQSTNKNHAADIAVKAIWQACGDKTPEVLERNISHDGLMNETTSDVYETARYAAAVLGSWTPSVNNSRYTAAYKFRCSDN